MGHGGLRGEGGKRRRFLIGEFGIKSLVIQKAVYRAQQTYGSGWSGKARLWNNKVLAKEMLQMKGI